MQLTNTHGLHATMLLCLGCMSSRVGLLILGAESDCPGHASQLPTQLVQYLTAPTHAGVRSASQVRALTRQHKVPNCTTLGCMWEAGSSLMHASTASTTAAPHTPERSH